jgi:hypothetical protein
MQEENPQQLVLYVHKNLERCTRLVPSAVAFAKEYLDRKTALGCPLERHARMQTQRSRAQVPAESGALESLLTELLQDELMGRCGALQGLGEGKRCRPQAASTLAPFAVRFVCRKTSYMRLAPRAQTCLRREADGRRSPSSAQ